MQRHSFNLGPLERRLFLSRAAETISVPAVHGGACGCPGCGARFLPIIEESALGDTGLSGEVAGALSSLSALPVLHSNPSAGVKLYLDFNGDSSSSWGSFSPGTTAAFDQDNDKTSFSEAEIAAIREIWGRVAEKFSPFDLDVTTEDPGEYLNGEALRVVIGGNGAWYGSGGGVAYTGGFTNSSPNTVWVFEDRLSSNAKYIAEASAHEAGHGFGLRHQSLYNSDGNLADTYNPGTSARAPIMGNSYSASRGLWWNGTTSSSSTLQDDVAVLAGATNGFGYRVDDYLATTQLVLEGSLFEVSGIIEKVSDTDVFGFTTGGGAVSFSAAVAQYGAMLDLKLEIRDAGGLVVASAGGGSLGESISTTLAPGSYTIIVMSQGNYGDIGQYTLSGSYPAALSAPPAADAGGPYAAEAGSSIQLSGAASTGDALTYLWDLDNDGIFGETASDGARGDETGVTPTFISTSGDGGSTLTIRLRVTDGLGRLSVASAQVTLSSVAPSDQAAPAATLIIANATKSGAATWTFVVRFVDNVGIGLTTINGDEILVAGPNGFSRIAALASKTVLADGAVEARYQIAAPGGSWNAADNGIYNINLRAGTVADSSGNPVTAAQLGSMKLALVARPGNTRKTALKVAVAPQGGSVKLAWVLKPTDRQDYYRIDLASPMKISGRYLTPLGGAFIELQRRDGRVILGGVSSLAKTLKPGRYYLRSYLPAKALKSRSYELIFRNGASIA